MDAHPDCRRLRTLDRELGRELGRQAVRMVQYSDLFRWPEGFAGFGSRINCVGVAFAIKVGGRTATKRETIRCPNS
jgi:hypothetical protein